MLKIDRRTQIIATLLLLAGFASLTGCESAPIFPPTALAWTTGYRGEEPPAPPLPSARPAVAPTTPWSNVTGTLVAPQDVRQSTAVSNPPLPPAAPQIAVSPPASNPPRTVLPVNSATFAQDVLQADVPVLVDFYAEWCGPCKVLAPTLEQVAAENPQARVVKVNIDISPELATRYGVKSVPRLVVFKEGRIAAQQNGVVSKERLNAMLAL